MRRGSRRGRRRTGLAASLDWAASSARPGWGIPAGGWARGVSPYSLIPMNVSGQRARRVWLAACGHLFLAMTLFVPGLQGQRAGERGSRGATLSEARSEAGSGGVDTLWVDGQPRTFLVRPPIESPSTRRGSGMGMGTARGQSWALVMVLHGGGGQGSSTERSMGFSRLRTDTPVLWVYPDGTARGRVPMRTWNAEHCCGVAMTEGVDDVRFLGAVFDTLLRRYPIDSTRIFVTGMSNGAMMTHRLARAYPNRIRAIAPVMGALFTGVPPAAGPVSMLAINGLADANVPPAGGLGEGFGRRSWDGVPPLPAAAQGTYWAQANGCAPTPSRQQAGRIIRWTYRCPAGRLVERVELEGQTHAWPGKSLPWWRGGGGQAEAGEASYEASVSIWAFFAQFPSRLPQAR